MKKIAIIGMGIKDPLETIIRERGIQAAYGEPARRPDLYEPGPSIIEMGVTELLDCRKYHPLESGQRKHRAGGNNRKKKKSKRS